MDLNIPEELDQLRLVTRKALAEPSAQRGAFGDGSATADDRDRLLGALVDLGILELDAFASPDGALGAALAVGELGAAAGAAPVIPRLLAVASLRPGLLHPIGAFSRELLLNHVDLDFPSEAVSPDGSIYAVRVLDSPRPAIRPMVPYASIVELKSTGMTVDPDLWDFGNILAAFFAAGSSRTAIDLACEHVTTRIQFGQPLASFQGVRNRIADAVIAERGLAELALYTLWRFHAKPSQRRVDELMLRYHQLTSTREIFASVHQLHAAIGFCYEYPLLQHSLGLEFDRQVPLNERLCLAELRMRYREIETNYEQLPAPWALFRSDDVHAIALSDDALAAAI